MNPDDPLHMPRGTYPVTFRCRCRGNARYHNAYCPDRGSHGVWAEQPAYVDPVIEAAREYHEAYMAEVDAARRREAS